MNDLVILINEGKLSPLGSELERLGLNIYKHDWNPSPERLSEISACLVSFYDCLSHPLRILKLRRLLAPRGIPILAWNRDAPGYINKAPWRLNLLEKHPLLDIYLTHAIADQRSFAPEQFLIHNGVNPRAYNLGDKTLDELDCSESYLYDVTFFGAMNAERMKEYSRRRQFFADLSTRLLDKGISFNFIDTHITPLSLEQQIRLIQGSRINMNYSAACDHAYPHGFGLPERCFGIPACGGFLLSDYRTHARDVFDSQYEWADFRDLEEAVKKIEYYLSHFDEARQIARNAHLRVMSEHTYRHRAETMCQIIRNWVNPHVINGAA